jgi:hypothetical protein
VHADVGHARLLRRDLNCSEDVAGVDRRAELGGEHQPVVLTVVGRAVYIDYSGSSGSGTTVFDV